LHIVGEPGQIQEIKKQKDVDAEKVLAALLKESPDMGINKLRETLKEAGIRKGAKWVTQKRAELAGAGVSVTAE
jgi:S-adenosylmethionine/arginine decarboxylase-like enzyme